MSAASKAAKEIFEEHERTVRDPERNKPVEHNMKFRVVMMTPKWAEELLKHNHPNNRRMKHSRIAGFERDMKAGFWKLTHQGIATDEDGWLVDGQNRLQAVVNSGCAVPMLLVTGVPRKAMVAADYTSTRSAADSARIFGKAFGTNENAWASTARHMQIGLGDISQPISHQEIIAFVGAHKEALDFAFELLANNKRGLCSSPLRAVIARAWYKRNSRSRIRLFCQYLLSGLVDNSKTDMAVIKLRNWMLDIQARGQGGSSSMRKQIYAKTEEALSLFLQEQECERLGQTRVELFPLSTDEDEVDE